MKQFVVAMLIGAMLMYACKKIYAACSCPCVAPTPTIKVLT